MIFIPFPQPKDYNPRLVNNTFPDYDLPVMDEGALVFPGGESFVDQVDQLARNDFGPPIAVLRRWYRRLDGEEVAWREAEEFLGNGRWRGWHDWWRWRWAGVVVVVLSVVTAWIMGVMRDLPVTKPS